MPNTSDLLRNLQIAIFMTFQTNEKVLKIKLKRKKEKVTL